MASKQDTIGAEPAGSAFDLDSLARQALSSLVSMTASAAGAVAAGTFSAAFCAPLLLSAPSTAKTACEPTQHTTTSSNLRMSCFFAYGGGRAFDWALVAFRCSTVP